MKTEIKKISDFKDNKAVLKSDLLSHVLGGLADDATRCKAAGSHYNDSIYVAPPPRPR